jgi:hypothetical protein
MARYAAWPTWSRGGFLSEEVAGVIHDADVAGHRQVIPNSVGAHPASLGSFVLMEFAEPDPTLVYIETVTGSLFVETPEEVALHRANFEHLIARALSPAETRKMITAKRKEYQ